MAGLLESVMDTYVRWSPQSARLAETAQRVFPGGDTRSSAHFAPYPLSIERAAGCQLYDADGHTLLDFMNNFTSLVHGHAQPDVVRAVQDQMAVGSAYAAPNRNQIALAEHLCERIPSVQQLRFCSSGSEATLMAIRCARAHSGKQKIMKMEGGYHGSYELAEVSLAPLVETAGPLDHPAAVAIDASFPDSVLSDVVICPYNEPELAVRLIAEHAADLAAVIMEPVLGSMGMVPATPEFIRAVRDATASHGVILIFDEVITLRLGDLGAQQRFGVEPDLTAMGKIIGGGLPIGALGGSAALMRQFHPEQARPVMHASTFSGNALSMAAGLAAMQRFNGQERERIDGLADRLRDGFNHAFQQHGIRGQAIGLGSVTNLHFTDQPVHNARDAMAATRQAGRLTRALHLAMLLRGVASAPRLMYCTSTAMSASDVDFAVAALGDALHALRDDIASEKPQLLTN